MKSFKIHIAEAVKLPKWKKVGNDGEMEIAFPTRKFRIEKFYDTNMKTGDIRHKGEWLMFEWNTRMKDWEWGETYGSKSYAKEQIMKLGEWDNKGKKIA